MATTATIKQAWTDGTNAYLSVTVTEGTETTEYVGSVPNDAAFQALSGAAKKAALVAAVKAVRDQTRTTPSALGGITGTVAI